MICRVVDHLGTRVKAAASGVFGLPVRDIISSSSYKAVLARHVTFYVYWKLSGKGYREITHGLFMIYDHKAVVYGIKRIQLCKDAVLLDRVSLVERLVKSDIDVAKLRHRKNWYQEKKKREANNIRNDLKAA